MTVDKRKLDALVTCCEDHVCPCCSCFTGPGWFSSTYVRLSKQWTRTYSCHFCHTVVTVKVILPPTGKENYDGKPSWVEVEKRW